MLADSTSKRATLAALAPLFFLSGVSGLVYQVVWFRMLARAFGVTVYAITTVLVVFMAGLAIGSFGASRLLRGRATLRTYGALELLVGASGAVSSLLMPLLAVVLAKVVVPLGPHQAVVAVVRGVLSCLVLLPPTMLMGATLPVLTGYTAANADANGAKAGLLYGFNTFGAVVGVLLTGFVLIATVGEKRTILIAVGLNVAIGLASLAIARSSSEIAAPPLLATAPPSRQTLSHKILLVALASGICALSFEIIWFRVLAVLLGNSVYAFSSMLGAYLTGISVGSLVMSRRVATVKRPILTFALLEIGVAVLALVSLKTFVGLGTRETEEHVSYAVIWSTSDIGRLGLQALLVVLPATLLYGAIFPLATRLVTSDGRTPDAAVGQLYGYNTVGSIIGSLLTGALLIPFLGTHVSFLLMAGASLAIGLYLVWLAAGRELAARPGAARWIGGGSSVVMAALLAVSMGDPFVDVLKHRIGAGGGHIVAQEEDAGATITVFESGRRHRALYINGLYVSNTAPGIGEQMINFPLAFDPEPGPKRILVVGLGVGESLRYAVDVGHDITVVELHAPVVDLFRRLNPDQAKYLESPHAHIVIQDGRNYLLNSHDKFDIILVDGSPPVYASGMVNLYSLEFATLAREHLTDAGAFVVWFPVICFEDDFWMAEHNFVATFPEVATFSPPGDSNAMLMGAKAPHGRFSHDIELLTARVGRWRVSPTRDAGALLTGMVLTDGQIRAGASRVPAVTDDHPYTEFPLMHFLRDEPYHADNRFLFPARFPGGSHRCAPDNLADCALQCAVGQPESCFYEGSMLLAGKVAPPNAAGAADLFRVACDAGSFEACSNLGLLTQTGHGVSRDEVRAATLFKRACDGNALIACRLLGAAYQNGVGVSRDDAEAASLAIHACNAEFWPACSDLADLYDAGRGLERDAAKALALRSDACHHGFAAACAHPTGAAVPAAP